MNTDQINYAGPSITVPLVLANEHQTNITDQIIGMINKFAEHSNGCNLGELAATRAYYVTAAHVDKPIQRQILELFPVPRTSLTEQMSGLNVSDD